MLQLALATLVLTADAGVSTMTSLELAQKLKSFAKEGGGEVFAVAVTAEPNRRGYTFGHWAGFFTTAALRENTVTRPSPAYLLVCNHPYDRESKNQNVVVYSKWGTKGRGSEDFKAAAMKLLKGP